MEDRYEVAFRRASEDPRAFWSEAATRIDWYRPWDEVLDDSRAPFVRWFAGAQVNTCFNALDRHVEGGGGDRTALIYDSAMTGEVRSFSYRALRDAVPRFAGVLASLGVMKGE